jgi:two-component system, cell cycle sensor histidine kinase and response regulator CckA
VTTDKPKANRGTSGTDEGNDTDLSARICSLAGGIAHDLNTIITVIYGYAEMALESLEDNSSAAGNMSRIIGAANRARTLTGQLLDLSRSSSREMIPVRVGDVITETIDFIMPSVRSNILVTQNLTNQDIFVVAEPPQLFRVFLNIAVNALQSIGEAGGSLTVTLDTVASGDALIRFADTGSGMAPETVARIFEPFFTEGKKGGTGFGLTVVRDIVSEMNGKLEVSSGRGKGTVIDVLIPAVEFGSLPEKPYLRAPEA